MSAEAQVPEAVVARFRSHGRALVLPSLALVGISLATGYFYGTLPLVWENLAVIVTGAILAVLLFVIPLLAWLGRSYTVTTRRIVLRSGLFVRVRQELLHSRGYDVTVRKTALQSVFGCGDVSINTGLDRPVVLRDVPSADLVQGALHDLMEKSTNTVAARRQQEQAIATDQTTAWGVR